MLLSDVCLSRTSGKTPEQRPMTKIGTEVAHVTHDTDIRYCQFAGGGGMLCRHAHILFRLKRRLQRDLHESVVFYASSCGSCTALVILPARVERG